MKDEEEAQFILDELRSVSVWELSQEAVVIKWFSLLYSRFEKVALSQLKIDIDRISRECKKESLTTSDARMLSQIYKHVIFFAVWDPRRNISIIKPSREARSLSADKYKVSVQSTKTCAAAGSRWPKRHMSII